MRLINKSQIFIGKTEKKTEAVFTLSNCKKGRMIIAEIIPRSHSPGFLVLSPQMQLDQ